MKFCPAVSRRNVAGRTRKGAWIEMEMLVKDWGKIEVAPARVRGLKFEILGSRLDVPVAPARVRGLKCSYDAKDGSKRWSHPPRVRGLKCAKLHDHATANRSLP